MHLPPGLRNRTPHGYGCTDTRNAQEETMKKQLGFVLATTLIVAAPAFAQREEREGGNARQENKEKKKEKDERKEDRAPRGNNGRIPPPPERRPPGRYEREGEPRERGKLDEHPHVNND